MNETSYRKLAAHLDQLPGGFGPSETGAEIRLLRGLFSVEEAELAIHLTLDREKADVISKRANLPLSEVKQRLDEMSNKGLIFSVHLEDGSILYQAVPFVIGIYEFQVNKLNEELLQDLADYRSTQKQRPKAQTIPQMRTIPVGESIETHLQVFPYEQVNELVKANDRFAVAPCICRRQARMTGAGCDAPEESCLMFGEWADYYVRDGRARPIDQSEVIEILRRADEANLVLQPSNSKDIGFICCCCGCCCGVLRGLQNHPRPSEAVSSSFIVQLNADICDGCWDCLERCQMQALSENDKHVTLNSDRCIGCGLCVTICPSEALKLVRKPDSEIILVPDTIDAVWRIISQAQSEMR